MAITPSPQQEQAISKISDPDQWQRPHQFAWLAGFAGSGKTSIAPHIIEAYGARRPLFVAPTNKAAKVLTSKGLPAISIHKACYHPPGEDDPKVMKELKEQIAACSDPAEKQTLEERLRKLEDSVEADLVWRINPEGAAAQADLILCDEASMVGTQLGGDLLSFGVPVIAIGDPGQLPPVKDTPFFCAGKPDFLLSEIHRQAADNPIIRLSQDIRNARYLGDVMRPCNLDDRVKIVHRGSVDIPSAPEDMPQVLVGTHKTRWLITEAMRRCMGFEGFLPQAGEKLVVRKNSKTHGALINGVEAEAIKFEPTDDEQVVTAEINVEGVDISCRTWSGPFRELRNQDRLFVKRGSSDWAEKMQNEMVDLGWAITGHVSQGSQWEDVLVYDESKVFRDDARKWLYTAVTRAAERLTIMI